MTSPDLMIEPFYDFAKYDIVDKNRVHRLRQSRRADKGGCKVKQRSPKIIITNLQPA